jgi:hypothetical protein
MDRARAKQTDPWKPAVNGTRWETHGKSNRTGKTSDCEMSYENNVMKSEASEGESEKKEAILAMLH